MDLALLSGAISGGAAEIEAARCYKHFRYFLERAWREIDPAPFIKGWHTDAIADHLQAVYDGHIKNLIINIPPGLGKSMIASVLWPAWCWARKPSLQFMGASYEAQLSTRDAVKCRTLMSTPWYINFFRSTSSPFLVTPWDFEDDQNLKTMYKNTARGHRQAIGVGGKGTGYRGDCLAAGTVIDTEAGPIAIEALCAMAAPPRVWSLNHETGKVELARILATSQQNKRVREIRTVAGSAIRCSDEHKIYANGDYVRSDDLKQGDALIKSRGASVPSLQGDLSETYLRNKEAAKTRAHAVLLKALFYGLHERAARQGDLVRGLWGACVQSLGNAARGLDLLLGGVQARAQVKGHAGHMPLLQGGIYLEQFQAPALLEGMRGQDSQFEHDRRGKLALQGGSQLRGVVPFNEAPDIGAGRVSVRQLQSARDYERDYVEGSGIRKIQPDYSSHRRAPAKQLGEQPDHALHLVSHEAPQVEEDSIALVGGLGRESEPVYDLQLDRNHNFFANKILVHNCLIIDDPISAGDAHSKVKREAAIRWKDETMSSRFNNKAEAREVLIMQRLHEEDLTGHLLQKGGWEHLRLPARFEAKDPCRTRTWHGADFWKDPRKEEGALLFPALLSDKVLTKMKVDTGSYGFAGQYQQRPAPASGGIIKSEWFNRRWALPGVQAPEGVECRTVPLRFDHISMFTDAAFKKTEDSDYVAIGVFGVKGPDVYLLQIAWKQMTFSETVAAILDLHSKWSPQGLAGVFVEDKANGTAVMDVLKGKISGIIPVEPDGGKEARIAAVAPFIEAGNLWLPLFAPWVSDYITEASSFPKAAHDDAIDMTAYALVRYCGSASANFLDQLSRAPGFH